MSRERMEKTVEPGARTRKRPKPRASDTYLRARDVVWAARRIGRRAILGACGFLPAWIYQEFTFRFGGMLAKMVGISSQVSHEIRKVVADGSDTPEIDEVIRSHVAFLYRSRIIRTLSWGLRFNRSKQWNVQGLEHLDTALGHGRGVILASVHVGHPRLILPILRAHGYPVMQVVAEGRRDLVRRVRWERWRTSRGAPKQGVLGGLLRLLLEHDDIGAGLDVRPIFKVLSRNHPVLIVGDGVKTTETVDVSLMGGKYPFAVGFMKIAMMTGAPVLPTFVMETKGGRRVRLEILPPIPIDPAASAAENVRALGRIVERHLKDDPYQWYRLERLVPEESAPQGEAFGGRKSA